MAYPRGRAKVDATLKAANRYVDAVKHFETSGPKDYLQAIADSIARATVLFGTYNHSLDALVAAVDLLIPHFENGDDVGFLGAIAASLHSKSPSPSIQALYLRLRAIVDGIPDLQTKARCAIDLLNLAASARQKEDYLRWRAGVVADVALKRVNHVAPLAAAYELKYALELASDSGHPLRGDLLTAFTLIKTALQNAGSDMKFETVRVTDAEVEHDVGRLRSSTTVHDRLLMFSKIVTVPTETERRAQISRIPWLGIGSFVKLMPMGDHGPTGEDPDSLASYQATDTLILFRAGRLDLVCNRADLNSLFPATEVADLFFGLKLIDNGQQIVFSEIWNAWAQGRCTLALFGLLPMIEQVFRCACARGLVLSRGRSLAVPVGATLVPHVREEFGDDIAHIYEHLLGAEGARRHAYAHGFLCDDGASEPLAAFCAYLLSVAYAHVATSRGG